MAYLDLDIDKAVAYVGGGYRIIWDDKNGPYLIDPLPASVTDQKLHVLDWASPVQSIYVQRFKPEELAGFVRSGDYLEKAWNRVEEFVGDATITEVEIYYNGSPTPTLTYVVSVGDVLIMDPDLKKAKWEAVGIWGILNVTDCLNPTYLKTKDDAVFLTDEKTFFIIQ